MTLRLLLLSGLLVGVLAAPPVAAQQGPDGLWTGHWVRGGSSLAVEMTFLHTESGYEGSFSSSQLQRIGVPLTRVRYEAPALLWEIVGDETTTAFEGSLRGDTLAGDFHEGTTSGTFSLTRGTSTEAPVREDEVTFGSDSVTLSGPIVSPAGAGPFPGIVFLHGSGAEGRWASRYLAHEFARRGVAALIYDKRGVGRSTGNWRTVGFLELVRDASAAVEILRSQPQVMPGSVGIYGHSQGGTIAPWVATENRHIAFVVAAAPSGVSMAEMETYSLENDLNVRGLPATEKRLAKRYVRALVTTAYDGAPRSKLDRVWEDVRGHSWAFKPPPASDFWWSFSRRIASYDPLHFWRRVTVPALLLYGEEDEREPPRRSAARIAEAYLGVHGPRLDVIFFPLADHNYRLRQNARGAFAWPKTAPGYPERMIEWVLQATKA
jgi:pimeloyl-ACP methyl ester carboxylesterase